MGIVLFARAQSGGYSALGRILYWFGIVTIISGCAGTAPGLDTALDRMLNAHYQKIGQFYVVIGEDNVFQTEIRDSRDPHRAVIASSVFAYGWDDAHIIAKQHPHKPEYIDGTPVVPLNPGQQEITQFFVIEIASGAVYGPMNEVEFEAGRRSLGVNMQLTFTVRLRESW